jgi:hypothetical protein
MIRTSYSLLALTLSLSASLALAPVAVSAQEGRETVIRVTDVQGQAIPYALVQIERGASRVSDDSGRAVFKMTPPDSIRLQVRRMGFNPYIGWAKPIAGTSEFLADLIPLPRALNAVTVEGRRDTPLARRGFYDRMERAERSAVAARFITPEELDMRNPLRVTQMLSGDRYVRVQPSANQKQILMSSRNPNCAMSILIDGARVTGTLEEAIGFGNRPQMAMLQSIDEVIGIQSVAAIEIYASSMQAPIELQRAVGNSQSCGIVALWTGSRR